MADFIKNNPIYSIILLFTFIVNMFFIFSVIIYVILEHKDKIKKTDEYKEHLLLGFLIHLTVVFVYISDINHNISEWFNTLFENRNMLKKYILISLLELTTLYHIYKRHLK